MYLLINLEAYKNSFFPRTIREWNALDASLVDSPSVDAFRERLKATHRRQLWIGSATHQHIYSIGGSGKSAV